MAYKDPDRKRAYNKAYYEAHRGDRDVVKRRAIELAYYYRHLPEKREQWNARARAYAEARRGERAEYNKAYYLAHAEKQREAQRKRYLANPEVYKEYADRRWALKHTTAVEKVDLKKILRAANGVCGICKEPFDLFGIEFDHIMPLSRGGTHTRDNIQAAHTRCNRSKGARVVA